MATKPNTIYSRKTERLLNITKRRISIDKPIDKPIINTDIKPDDNITIHTTDIQDDNLLDDTRHKTNKNISLDNQDNIKINLPFKIITCNNNITHWTKLFADYCVYETLCIDHLNIICEIKNNLKKLLGNQKKDDLIFYKAIIENSYYYLSNCLKIRKLKFLKDINFIWSCIDSHKQIDNINKYNFTTLMQEYNKIVDDINFTKKNNTILTWVKNDTVESIHELERDISEILEYHVKLIKSLSKIIEYEKLFYHGE
jgi:hypothetical protein